MLLLSNEDAEQLLTIKDCVEILEQTYLDAHAGATVNGYRSDMIAPTGRPDAVYSLKMMGSVAPRYEVGAIRLNSDVLAFPQRGEKRRKIKIPAAPGERWVGLVLLFSTQTGEPLAIFPDGVVQRLRVGATSALGVQYLARKDAQRVALLGSGWQAGTQAAGVAAVRNISEIRCFSPNRENRRAFAKDAERTLNISVIPAESVEHAVQSADIVLCATNSLAAVLPDVLVEPGMHVGSIREGELERQTLTRANRLVIHHPDNMSGDHVVSARGAPHQEQVRETSAEAASLILERASALQEVIAGTALGRNSLGDITCFLNFHGLAFQFAAAGALLYRKAMEAGCGRQLPTEWFTETVHP